ncbi:MAG TPA: UvrD-helicase domain-containing protein [Thiobacillaceae bacterium]|nr:UvrD-helicase domain-containing protein [Thiobacillaceae bacterium]
MNATEQLAEQALDPRHSVVVEACAGSGKTWLLVSRILRLLLDGVPPGEILAITFTRKAALEMSARLDGWLRELATRDDDWVRKFLRERAITEANLDVCMPRARQLYEAVLTAQPGVTLTTFHSWFLDVLKRAPIEEGLAGRELSEQTGALEKESWLRLGEQLAHQPEGELALAFSRLLLDIGAFNARKLLGRFLAERLAWQAITSGSQGALQEHLAGLRLSLPVDPDTDLSQALRADAALTAQLRECAALFALHHKAGLYRKAALGIDLALAASGECFLDQLAAVFLTRTGEPRRDCPKPGKALNDAIGVGGAVRLLQLHEAICLRLIATLDNLKAQKLYRFNADGLRCGQALLDHYQAVKRERALLDFADVEWECARLLGNSEQADFLQYKLDARYRHILLDEFQDTSPLQWQILSAWLQASQSADRLPTIFLVGDPKQSIYRFRGAEARLFQLAGSWLEQTGARRIALNHTRRLAPALVEAVNRVFTPLRERYPEFSPHEAQQSELPGRLEVLPLAPAPGGSDAGQARIEFRNPLVQARPEPDAPARVEEAQALVAKLLQIEGRWKIRDPDNGRTRPARWQDVLILVRTRSHLHVYESALKAAGIPYASPRRGGLLDTLEAGDLIALLRVLSAPWNDLALAMALKCPVFNVSDDELQGLAHNRPASLWEQLMRAGQLGSASLQRAALLLGEWHSLAGRLPVHDLLDRIYHRGEVCERYAAATSRGLRDSVQANLRVFMELALATSGGRYPGLPDFLAELAQQRRGADDEAPDEGEMAEVGNALRILTVHGAKGLEAPIVWLLDAGARKSPGGGHRVVLDWRPGEPAPRHFSLCGDKTLKGAFQQSVLDQEEQLAQIENFNLLYVAMTRARQGLIVSGAESGSKGAEENWQGVILNALAADDDVAQAALGQDLSAIETEPPLAPRDKDSALPSLPTLHLTGPVGSLRSSNTAAEFGELVHAVLERLAPPAQPAEREAVRSSLGTLPRFDEAWDRARRILQAPQLNRFFDPDCYIQARNELSYLRADGSLRRIDRVVEFADEIWVLDYKTGEQESAEALLARYRAQVEEYRHAITALMPGKAVRSGLISADGDLLEF